MSDTLANLLHVHKAAVVPLADICETYFGLSPAEARRKAALNQLPVPTWRAIASRKAPVMVRLSDLAQHLDAVADEAARSWEKSQV